MFWLYFFSLRLNPGAFNMSPRKLWLNFWCSESVRNRTELHKWLMWCWKSWLHRILDFSHRSDTDYHVDRWCVIIFGWFPEQIHCATADSLVDNACRWKDRSNKVAECKSLQLCCYLSIVMNYNTSLEIIWLSCSRFPCNFRPMDAQNLS